MGFKIVKKEYLNDSVCLMEVLAKDVARHSNPGQFIILRVSSDGERIPLTIHDYDLEKGTVSIIFQIVGVTTYKLSLLNEGDEILDFVGPLGNKTELDNINKALVIGGGVGSAISYPICKKLFNDNKYTDAILGFRNKDFIILEDKFINVCNNLTIFTDDGSNGNKGFVTSNLDFLLQNNKYDCIFVIGPLIMMKNVCSISKKYNVKTICSMNPIMIDGTGMCGGCRLYIDGVMKFACVDGPDFDGFKVDFDEMIKRNNTYKSKERDKYCNLLKVNSNESK